MLAVAIATIGSCTTVPYQVKTGTVWTPTLQQMESLNMDRAAPVLIRIYKEERTLEIWKQDRTGRFALLKSYPICKYSGKLGPKIVEGDYQAPEGFYDITPDQMNPWKLCAKMRLPGFTHMIFLARNWKPRKSKWMSGKSPRRFTSLQETIFVFC